MEIKGKIFKTGVEELEKLVDKDSLIYLGLISVNRRYLIDPLGGKQIDMDSVGRTPGSYTIYLAAPEEVMKAEYFSNGNYINGFNANSVLQAAHNFIDAREKDGTFQFFIVNVTQDIKNRLDGELYKSSK